MKVGDLVKSAEAWGPDDCGEDGEYYPIGVIYRQHKTRLHRWWVRWVSPDHLAGDPACMLDEWLEILNEGR